MVLSFAFTENVTQQTGHARPVLAGRLADRFTDGLEGVATRFTKPVEENRFSTAHAGAAVTPKALGQAVMFRGSGRGGVAGHRHVETLCLEATDSLMNADMSLHPRDNDVLAAFEGAANFGHRRCVKNGFRDGLAVEMGQEWRGRGAKAFGVLLADHNRDVQGRRADEERLGDFEHSRSILLFHSGEESLLNVDEKENA